MFTCTKHCSIFSSDKKSYLRQILGELESIKPPTST